MEKFSRRPGKEKLGNWRKLGEGHDREGTGPNMKNGAVISVEFSESF